MPEKIQTIAVDFDGVIHKYSKGFNGGEIYDKPVRNAFKGIQYLQKMGFAVYIHSTRDPQQIIEWMENHAPEIKCAQVPSTDFFWNYTDVVGVTDRKLPAVGYIDDRAVPFGRGGMMSWSDVVTFFVSQDMDALELEEAKET